MGIEITVHQAHTMVSFFRNNIDWVYLSTNFNLSQMIDLIKKNENRIGYLFTKLITDTNFVEVDKSRKKTKGIISETEIKKTFEIAHLLDKNIQLSLIDFKEHEIQKRIIGNPFGVGQKGTDFLTNIMTNPELELV